MEQHLFESCNNSLSVSVTSWIVCCYKKDPSI